MDNTNTNIPLYSDVLRKESYIPDTPEVPETKGLNCSLSSLSEEVIDKMVMEKKSIVDFDFGLIRELDSKHTLNISDDMLLKILMVRGKDKYNPALNKGVERLLRQLNGETLKTFNKFDHPKPNFQQNYQPNYHRRNYNNKYKKQNPKHDQNPNFNTNQN